MSPFLTSLVAKGVAVTKKMEDDTPAAALEKQTDVQENEDGGDEIEMASKEYAANITSLASLPIYRES